MVSPSNCRAAGGRAGLQHDGPGPLADHQPVRRRTSKGRGVRRRAAVQLGRAGQARCRTPPRWWLGCAGLAGEHGACRPNSTVLSRSRSTGCWRARRGDQWLATEHLGDVDRRRVHHGLEVVDTALNQVSRRSVPRLGDVLGVLAPSPGAAVGRADVTPLAGGDGLGSGPQACQRLLGDLGRWYRRTPGPSSCRGCAQLRDG